MTDIVQKDDKAGGVLRETAQEVPISEINSEKIKKLLASMAVTLEKYEDGVALAAPQVGVSLRIFVVSPRAFAYQQGENAEEASDKKEKSHKTVYINPVITRRSSKKIVLDEGCLSVAGVFGKIKRHEKVTLTAYDEHGKKFTRGATGLLAEIFQHETDHLDGKLFVDSATDFISMPPKKKEDAESTK